MSHLSKNEVDMIESQIEKQGITYKPLKEELLDHICSDVEDRMRSGYEFHEAFNSLCQQFDIEPLKTIENETLISLNKKISIFNVVIYGMVAIFLMAVFFKFMRWPGAGKLLFFSLTGLSIIFLLTAIAKVKYLFKGTDNILLTFTALLFSVFIASTLLITLGFPGGMLCKMISLTGLGIIFTIQSFRLVNNHVLFENGFTMVIEKHSQKIENIILLFCLIVFLLMLYLPISPAYILYPVYSIGIVLSIFLAYGYTWIYFITKPEKLLKKKKTLLYFSSLTLWLTILYTLNIQDLIDINHSFLWFITLSIGLFGAFFSKDSYPNKSVLFIILIVFSVLKLLLSFELIPVGNNTTISTLTHSPIILLSFIVFLIFFRNEKISRKLILFLMIIFIGTYPVEMLPNSWLLGKVLNNQPYLKGFLHNSKNSTYNNTYYQQLEHFQRATRARHFFKASTKPQKFHSRILNDLELKLNNPKDEEAYFQWNLEDENHWAVYNLSRIESLAYMNICWGENHPDLLQVSVFMNSEWTPVSITTSRKRGCLTKYQFEEVYASAIRIAFKNNKNIKYRMYEWNVLGE